MIMDVKYFASINILQVSYESGNGPFIYTFCLKAEGWVELPAHKPACKLTFPAVACKFWGSLVPT